MNPVPATDLNAFHAEGFSNSMNFRRGPKRINEYRILKGTLHCLYYDQFYEYWKTDTMNFNYEMQCNVVLEAMIIKAFKISFNDFV